MGERVLKQGPLCTHVLVGSGPVRRQGPLLPACRKEQAKAWAAVCIVSTGSIGWTWLESLGRRPLLLVSLAVHSGFAVQPLCWCDVIRSFALTSSALPYRTLAFRRRCSCRADTT